MYALVCEAVGVAVLRDRRAVAHLRRESEEEESERLSCGMA